MKKKLDYTIVLIFSAIVSFIFLLSSPLHPWNNYDIETDSSVFKTVTMMMGKGYMPYRDTFDHKGPLLYIINLLGDQFSSYRGVWIVEFLFMIVTVFMLYKISRISCGLWESLVTAIASLSLLYQFFEGGNLVEEYAMCFIAISLFIFLDYLANNHVTRFRLVICGATFAGTLLLRPNMIPVWVVMCLTILIKVCSEKDWKNLKSFILYFCLGSLLVIVPIMLWLILKNDFSYFWDAYIVFNFEYTSDSSLSEMWCVFFFFFNHTIFYIAFLAQIYLLKAENKWLNYAHLLCMLVTFFSISFSGNDYKHYGMVLIPLITYPISGIFSQIRTIKTVEVKHVLSMLVTLYFVVTLIMPYWEDTIQDLPPRYNSRSIDKISETAQTVASYVKSNTAEDDYISVYGNWDFIYILSGRKHATRYSYQFPIGTVRPGIMNEYISELTEAQPPVIVIQSGYFDDTISTFLTENNYKLAWAENDDTITGASVYTK